jgi:copper(I)-binding protein
MSRPHRARLATVLGVLGAAVVMTACGGTGHADRASDAGSSGPITVSGAYVAALSTDVPAGMYFTIENRGPVPDTLVAISTTVAQRSELHREVMHGSSMIMEPVAEVPVPAGGALRLAPGGYHVMLTGLHHALAPGDTVAATLELRHAGQVLIRADVVSYAELEGKLNEGATQRR